MEIAIVSKPFKTSVYSREKFEYVYLSSVSKSINMSYCMALRCYFSGEIPRQNTALVLILS